MTKMRYAKQARFLPVLAAVLIAWFAHAAAPASASVAATTCSGAPAAVPDGAARSGDRVVVENNVGERNPQYGTTTDFGKVPFCAVQIEDGKATAPQWLFCTHNNLRACGQDVKEPVLDGPQLLALDEARLSWVLARARYETPLSRAITQTLVWCVSDRARRGRTDGQILAAARAQFASDQGITLPADLRCPDWHAIDPTLRPDPVLSVVADRQSVLAGDEASVTVTANIPSLRVAATDAAGQPLGVSVCAGQTGATLQDGVLTVADTSSTMSRTIRLCTPVTAAGSATVTVTAPDTPADRPTSVRSRRAGSECQLFVGAPPSGLSRRVDIVVAPAPVAVPTTPAAGTAVPRARLVVAKHRARASGERRRARSGDAVSWRITVRNPGTVTATRVRICDVLPRGLVLRRAGGGNVLTGGRVCWRVSRLAPGGRATRRLTTIALPDPAIRRCRRLVNRVTVTARNADTVRGAAGLTVCRPHRPSRPGGATG